MARPAFNRVHSVVGALVSLAVVSAAPSIACAQSVNVSMQGVIVTRMGGQCTVFEGDDGAQYFLSTQGNFTAGDRVHVAGSYDPFQAGTCVNIAAPLIQVTTIAPAFAGVGTITNVSGTIRLVTDDGRTFGLTATGPYRAGTRVYVQGPVNAGSRTVPIISNSVIGTAFSGFGRITTIAPGNLRFTAENGQVFTMDRPGSIPNAIEGDYIYVEAIRSKTDTGVPALSSVTSRPAFQSIGTVVATPNGNAFKAGTVFFSDEFTASAIAGYPVGTTLYVRGRSADDYDFNEVKPPNDIRLSRADLAFSVVGTLNTAAKTVTSVTNGTVVHVQYTGNPVWNPSGSLVYAAGTIDTQGPGSVTLYHNEVRLGINLEGTLLNGFGCTPIIRFDGGGYIFAKNNGSLPINTHVRVIGGYTADDPCNDEDGLIDNTIVVTPAPCPNCE